MAADEKQWEIKRVNNPRAEIPLKNEYDEIDLDALGTGDLETWIKGDHIKAYDDIYPIWRGTDASGIPFDNLGAATTVPENYDPAVGILIPILNRYVARDGGWAFYSYKVNSIAESAPDSLRQFCYLGLRKRVGAEALPVVQARESHDLEINWQALDTDGVTFFAPPYQAMQDGHSVDLVIQRFDKEGGDRGVVTQTYDVNRDNIGQPLQWQISRSQFASIREGQAEVLYKIDLPDGSDALTSPTQVFKITLVDSPTAYLPPARIDDYAGGPLDPGDFPDGLTVRVPAYAGMQVGDQLLLYWQGPSTPESEVQAARMDLSSLEVDDLVLRVGTAALELGENTLFYQYGRAGSALTSQALIVEVEPGRTLDAPLIERAKEDGAGKQVLDASDALLGAYVVVPDLSLGPDEKIEVHWQGYEKNGVQVTDTPEPGEPQRYKISPQVIAACMHQPRDNDGRRFQVFYQIVKDGRPQAEKSNPVDLRVEPLAPNPTFTCREADSSGNLPRSSLTPNGALLRISGGAGLWTFVAEGQLLTISIDNITDGVLRDAQPVMAEEMSAAKVEQWLSVAVYGRMTDGMQHTVRGRVSYDQGDSWHEIPVLRLTPSKLS